VKERPILFSADMVRAILDGRKTQTRRVVKGDPNLVRWMPIQINRNQGWENEHGNPINCPYGQGGDRLWVKETWATTEQSGVHKSDAEIIYRATDPDWETIEGWCWKPCIFMPRWASRIDLEITSIHVERLQDITEMDAIAEGMMFERYDGNTYDELPAKEKLADYWDSLNAKSGYPWESNPWVWVIEFKVIKPEVN